MPYPFEELPLLPPEPADEFLVYAIIEQEYGEHERIVWDEGQREFVKIGLVMAEPLPAPYGWLPRTLSGDGDALDVLVLSRQPLKRGQFLPVRPVAVMLRDDQDHKIVAVAPREAEFSAIRDLPDIPAAIISEMEDWFNRFFKLSGWVGANEARTMIEEAHTAYLAKNC